MTRHPKSGHSDEATQGEAIRAQQELDFTLERIVAGSIPSPTQGVRFNGNGERLLYHSRYENIRKVVSVGSSIPTDASGVAC